MKRKYFIFAACKKAPGYLDKRGWRNIDYDRFKNANESIITTEKLSLVLFKEYMHTSDFCLIIPGDTYSTAKLYQAIFSGCIPIIFLTYTRHLPYYRFIDWKKFSILIIKEKLNYENEINQLIKILYSIRNSNKLINYKEALYSARFIFDWDRITWPSVYHFTLLELAYSDSCHNIKVNDPYQLSNNESLNIFLECKKRFRNPIIYQN